MVTAIVHINAEVDRIPEVAQTIAEIDGVGEVYSITGEYDLLAMVRVAAYEQIAEIVPGRINKVSGVLHTETHIAFRAYSKHDLDAAFSIGLNESD
ncbi:Lrp/AsnC family transcriptional regulator [Nonomuraea sediminis]|uniref:Lrp/AsnC family transcriptional regulator n=1 Tax=Nonomuraea sediminis TaxID=2835864 RepID=UPI001BDCCD2B|nr:Lrp/AsnC ligand binding domain-containing protein [Nonomuraea sediminis]